MSRFRAFVVIFLSCASLTLSPGGQVFGAMSRPHPQIVFEILSLDQAKITVSTEYVQPFAVGRSPGGRLFATLCFMREEDSIALTAFTGAHIGKKLTVLFAGETIQSETISHSLVGGCLVLPMVDSGEEKINVSALQKWLSGENLTSIEETE